MFQSKFKLALRRSTLLSLFLFISFVSLVAQSLQDRIKALPDIISVEKMEQNQFFSEAFVVNVKQLVDHQHPEKGFFPQRVVLSHLSYDRPVVFVTEGYEGVYAIGREYLNELCSLLQANQLLVEHRY